MTMDMKERLINAAREVRERAYAPYSNYRVGAAILSENGKIYVGCNFENASFGAGSCAERVALGTALAAGERKFIAVACVGDGMITPCGICRQALSEFGDVTIWCAGADEDGEIREYKLSELLPHAFDL